MAGGRRRVLTAQFSTRPQGAMAAELTARAMLTDHLSVVAIVRAPAYNVSSPT